MAITLEQIKELRAKTGAGVTNVKEALENSKGDMDKAVIYLREKGLAKAVKRSDKRADKGFIAHYIHGEGSAAALVEINAETDFAAKNERFREIAHDIAVHIVASKPEYVSIQDVPADVLEKEKEILMKGVDTKKPAQVIEKIIEGKLSKFYEENVLLEQPFFKDDSKKIKDLINELVAAIGEKVEIGRFIRFELGGGAGYCNL